MPAPLPSLSGGSGRCLRLVAALSAAALGGSLLATAPLAPAAAAGDDPGGTAAPSEGAPNTQRARLDGVKPGSYEVTLITGDQVKLSVSPDGRYEVTVDEVAPRPEGSRPPSFESTTRRDGVYVIPSDVQPAVQAGHVDKELFDVKYLIKHGYTDAESKRLPVIVQYEDKPRVAGLRSQARAAPASKPRAMLPSIDGAGLTVQKKRADAFWQQLSGESAESESAKSKTTLARGIAKVWLDRKITVSLDESVPLIGASQAWGAGYDGSGMNVAVLDTGINKTHPDVASTVAASKNFVGGNGVTDGHGHGTHVAATVAGSGAASDGLRKGVAPGADLAVGKVLDNGGSGSTSGIIDGMEWAANQADADVISMSLGSGPTGGSDPASQAVNNLTESTGALFVIAAGNGGPASQTISAPGVAEKALTVAATSKQDEVADFSSRGPTLSGALKPDIAAPGVNIVAARADGTSLGNPVNENYTSLSGTSMATPHVAGAAAILAQQHPNWSPARLKSHLMSTAKDVGASVYAQGAGRLDVARTVGQTEVTSNTTNVDFGLTGDREEPITKQIRYKNTSDEPVTLSLDATLRSVSEEPAPEGALTTDDTVTVPADGTAAAAVTLDPALLEPTGYAGLVTATNNDGGVRLVTPVATDKRLALTIYTKNLPQGSSLVTRLVTVDSSSTGGRSSTVGNVEPLAVPNDGKNNAVRTQSTATTRFLVRPGTYHVQQRTGGINGAKQSVTALLIDPEVRVTSDTEITLDVAATTNVSLDTSRSTNVYGASHQIERSTASGTLFSFVTLALHPSSYQAQYRVTPTDEVTEGIFRFAVQRELSNPQLQMSVSQPTPLTLDPVYRAYGDREQKFGDTDFGWVPFRGEQTLRLVDAGYGRIKDIAGLDLKGKLALIRCGGPSHEKAASCYGIDPLGKTIYDRIERLERAGASGFVLFPLQDYPHALPGLTNGWTGFHGAVDIPGAQLRPSQGQRLARMLDQAPVTLKVHGDPNVHYTYSLKVYEEQQVPADMEYTFGRRDLARLDMNIHASAADQEKSGTAQQGWHVFEPGATFSAAKGASTAAPKIQPLYVGPLSTDAVWRGFFNIGPKSIDWQPRVFDQATRTEEHVNVVPYAPSAISLDAFHAAHPDSNALYEGCAMCRAGNVLWPAYAPVTGNGQTPPGGFTSRDMSLYNTETGKEIPQTLLGGVIPTFKLPEQRGTYRLEHHDPYSGANTTWTFSSAAPGNDSTQPGYGCLGRFFGRDLGPCQPEPLLFPSYDLTESLQLNNTVPAPGAHRFEVTVSNGQTVQSTQSASQIEGLKVWTSTDGGDTWERARVIPRGRDEGSKQTFRVIAVYPKPDRTSGSVSLKAEARDADGNRVEQVITDAFELSHRSPRKDG